MFIQKNREESPENFQDSLLCSYFAKKGSMLTVVSPTFQAQPMALYCGCYNQNGIFFRQRLAQEE